MEASSEENPEPEHKLSRPRRGGFRTMPFFFVNESFEKVSNYGLLANIILYMIGDYHMKLTDAAIILTLWSALSSALAVVGAFLSDSYMGRFKVIAIGSFFSFFGMSLLWITAMVPKTKASSLHPIQQQLPVINACPDHSLHLLFGLDFLWSWLSQAMFHGFGADQIDKKDNPKNERVLQSIFNWYYASIGASTIIALTLIVYIQVQWGWKIGFGVPAILMLVSSVVFLLGASLYIKRVPEKRLFSSFFQVLVAAFRNAKLPFPDLTSGYHRDHDSMFTAPTRNLRWLNKACIIKDPRKDLNPDGSSAKPWKLCTIEQVEMLEMLKVIILIIPIWSTSFMISVSINQQSFAIVQAYSMDRRLTSKFKIPAGSFYVFTIVGLILYVLIYDRVVVPVLAKFTGNQRGLSVKFRMGMGLMLSVAATTLCGVTETLMRRTANNEGFADRPDAVTSMSAMWLIPQYSFFGLAEAVNTIGQIEFIYSQLHKSMTSVGMALSTLGGTVASVIGVILVRIVDAATNKGGKEGWLADNINRGHLDYYYWLLTYYYICCWAFGPMGARPGSANSGVERTRTWNFDGLALKSWNLCSVQQVEEFKTLIRFLPLWASGIVIAMSVSQYSFPVIQASIMDRRLTPNCQIPRTSFGVFGFPKTMAIANLAESLVIKIVNDVTRRGGKVSWVSNNLNKAHYDYYYWLLAILNLINFLKTRCGMRRKSWKNRG
ncbi:hypothetical protein AAG906_009345 [Vitis piasezkii]